LLKHQHKKVIDAVQQGQAESISSGGEVQDVGGSGLALKWTNSSQESQGGNIILRFQVIDAGQPVAMAEVTVWPCPPSETVEIARALTDANGNAALVVPLTEEVLRDSAVMARATRRGKSATRKVRLRK
jgi:protocatechuate 3,4-dioxygenase beta subunit